jgi:hypothetical protein
MGAITYKPADVLHWLDEGSRASRAAGKKMAKESARTAADINIGDTLRKAAEAAKNFGKSAMAEIALRQRDDTTYVLDDDALEAHGATGIKRVLFSTVRGIREDKEDKYVIEHDSGSITIKPLAHLVAGSIKVPIGWKRSGIEVPYAMLIEEIAARSRVAITPL